MPDVITVSAPDCWVPHPKNRVLCDFRVGVLTSVRRGGPLKPAFGLSGQFDSRTKSPPGAGPPFPWFRNIKQSAAAPPFAVFERWEDTPCCDHGHAAFRHYHPILRKQALLRRTLPVWVLGTPAKRWTAACSQRGSIPLSSAHRPTNMVLAISLGHFRVLTPRCLCPTLNLLRRRA